MSSFELSEAQVAVCRKTVDLGLERYDETMQFQPVTVFAGPAHGGTYYADSGNDWFVGTAISTIRNDTLNRDGFEKIGFDSSAMSAGIWVIRSQTLQPDGQPNARDYPKRDEYLRTHKFAYWDSTTWHVMQAKPREGLAADVVWHDKWEPGRLSATEHDAITRTVTDTRLLYEAVGQYMQAPYNLFTDHVGAVAFTEYGKDAWQKYQDLLEPWRAQNPVLEGRLRTVFYQMGVVWGGVQKVIEGRMANMSSHEIESMRYAGGSAMDLSSGVMDSGGPNIVHPLTIHPPFDRTI